MSTPLIEQQIYLLERYVSLEYFGMMRDAFNAMLRAGYAALDEFMLHLPNDYRSQHLSHQPDIVWGERVLPNFARTAEYVDAAYERLAMAGDFTALFAANGVINDFAGVGRDYLNYWMPEPFRTEYDAKWSLVMAIAPDICNTVTANWRFGKLYDIPWGKHSHIYWKLLPPPKTWPIYRLNPNVQVRTGEEAPRSGIYLPEASESCPQFIIEGDPAWKAEIGWDESNFKPRSVEPTLWTLVERVADEGGPVPGRESWRTDNAPARVEGGQPCPHDGFWWTPASREGQGHFKKGDIMPNYTRSQYGATIWYREKK